MEKVRCILSFVVLLFVVGVAAQNYSNQWVISGNLDQKDIANIARRYGFTFIRKLIDNRYLFIKNNSPRSTRIKSRYLTKRLNRERNVKSSTQQQWQTRTLRQGTFTVNDAKWPNMWYYNGPTVDMGVKSAWQQGYDGSGVTIAIVDDGVDYNHPDLKDNYVQGAGIDVYDNDNDPMPAPGDKHGTSCAGVAIAVENNICVVGAAYKAKLKVVRLIGPRGDTDAGEQQAFTLGGVDIYSNSWGTTDGVNFDGPKSLSRQGLQHGISNGRGGLGSIYLTAAGNGGFEDNCNCDGYANSIYTISIMAVTKSLQPPGYQEPCAAALASAYSGPGGATPDDVCTTSPGNACPCDFTGTSAATPMAAGIIALMLQSRPKLTWRDVQYLIVRTSITSGLTYGNFLTNGVGRSVSDTYGYGLMNATALIQEAKTWTTVDPHHVCNAGSRQVNRQVVANGINRRIDSTITTDVCNNTSTCVNSLEHVEAVISFTASLRGAVQLTLQSPMRTSSKLLTRRNNDKAGNLRQDWTYMSTQFWDEDPVGTWTLSMDLNRDPGESATLISWSLRLYGTGESCTIPDVAPTKPPTQAPTIHITRVPTKVPTSCIKSVQGLEECIEQTTTTRNPEQCKNSPSGDECASSGGGFCPIFDLWCILEILFICLGVILFILGGIAIVCFLCKLSCAASVGCKRIKPAQDNMVQNTNVPKNNNNFELRENETTNAH